MGMESNFNEWINLADFLHANTYLSYFNSYWMGKVKYGCPFKSQDSKICYISSQK